MTVNPAGYVCPFDGNNPRIVTGIAMEAISGGQLVVASGAADAVSSGINSFATADIGIAAAASGLAFNGIAIQDAASGSEIAVATRGICIVRATGTVTNGYTVLCPGANGVQNGTTAGQVVGRAWSDATSGAYALVELK